MRPPRTKNQVCVSRWNYWGWRLLWKHRDRHAVLLWRGLVKTRWEWRVLWLHHYWPLLLLLRPWLRWRACLCGLPEWIPHANKRRSQMPVEDCGLYRQYLWLAQKSPASLYWNERRWLWMVCVWILSTWVLLARRKWDRPRKLRPLWREDLWML